MSVRVRVNLMDVELERLRKDKLWYQTAVANTSFDMVNGVQPKSLEDSGMSRFGGLLLVINL